MINQWDIEQVSWLPLSLSLATAMSMQFSEQYLYSIYICLRMCILQCNIAFYIPYYMAKYQCEALLLLFGHNIRSLRYRDMYYYTCIIVILQVAG